MPVLSMFSFSFLVLMTLGAVIASPSPPSSLSSPPPSPWSQASVVKHGNTHKVVPGLNVRGSAASGTFNDTLMSSGWGVLNVVTSSSASDNDQFYAAGFLEGVLTANRIWQMNHNLWSFYFPNSPLGQPPAVYSNFFEKQERWMRGMIASNPTSPLWIQAGFIQQQFDGLVDGYRSVYPAKTNQYYLSRFAFYMLNGAGDLLDLMSALEPEVHYKDWRKMSAEDFEIYFNSRSLCSALIKVTGDYSDLFAGHSSWFVFPAMNRIFKHYTFNVQASFVAAKSLSFSSYPGFLESLDDFYIMDSGLTMVQTTNSIYNQTLYDFVQPESLLAWHRVRMANHLATDGPAWYEVFEQYNSGTYNNQYMIVNYNLFQVGQPLPPNTLWVVEQIPTLVVGGDLTNQLERGYFASYNVPYFKEIFNLSGYPAVVAKKGTQYSYQLAARAEIFRRDQGTVVDMESFKAILRYNDFHHDPYSHGNPMRAICSRGDLIVGNPMLMGCYDTKVTNNYLQKGRHSHAINGPTRSHGLPPFSFDAFPNNQQHDGMPLTYEFEFEDMQPDLF